MCALPLTAPAAGSPDEAAAGVTERFASDAAALRLADVPEDVRRLARFALLDWYAVTWAGAGIGPVPLLRQLATQDGGNPEAQLLNGGLAVPAPAAALVNGAAGHVLDYDDVQNEVPGHATAPVAPALLAVAEATRASGAALLEAFIVAFEATCRIGRLLSPGHFQRGWQSSTIAGPIGGALGCGRLLGLPADRLEQAIGLAATQSAGLQAAFGSESKSFSVGHAARCAVIAARLVAGGMAGARGILEGPRGFPAVFADGSNPEHAFATPPGGWHLCRNLFKLHAACFMCHSPLEALAAIGRRRPLSPETVEKVVIRIEDHYHRVVLTPPPETGLAVKFNLPFCVALMIGGYDTGDPASYTDDLARRTDLHALAQRCVIDRDPSVLFTAAHVQVHFTDGTVEHSYVDDGEPDGDLAALEGRLRAKVALLMPELGDDARDAFIDRMLAVDSLDDIRQLHPDAA